MYVYPQMTNYAGTDTVYIYVLRMMINATDIDILWIVYILLSGTDDKGLAQRKRGDKITIKQRGTNSLTSH